MVHSYSISARMLHFLAGHILNPTIQQKIEEALERGADVTPGTYRSQRCTVTLSESERDRLLTELADLFTEIGLQPNQDPNDTGFFIAEIMDRFAPRQ